MDFKATARNIFAFLLGVSLAAFVCFANAGMTGYQFDNRCIATQAEVLEAFKYKAQSLINGLDYEVCGGALAPIITANTSYTGQTAPLAIKYVTSTFAGSAVGDTCTGSSSSVTRYLGIPACDPDIQSLAFTGTNALFLVLGFFYASMLGFKTGYRA